MLVRGTSSEQGVREPHRLATTRTGLAISTSKNTMAENDLSSILQHYRKKPLIVIAVLRRERHLGERASHTTAFGRR